MYMIARGRTLAVAMLAGAAVLVLAAPAASAAGTLQWAAAADTVVVEGGGVGYALTGLAIVLVGIVLALSYHSLLTAVLSLTLGGALAANYDPIRATLFPGGAAGG